MWHKTQLKETERAILDHQFSIGWDSLSLTHTHTHTHTTHTHTLFIEMRDNAAAFNVTCRVCVFIEIELTKLRLENIWFHIRPRKNFSNMRSGVNFIFIFRVFFVQKFFMTRKSCQNVTFVRKIRVKTLVKLTPDPTMYLKHMLKLLFEIKNIMKVLNYKIFAFLFIRKPSDFE